MRTAQETEDPLTRQRLGKIWLQKATKGVADTGSCIGACLLLLMLGLYWVAKRVVFLLILLGLALPLIPSAWAPLLQLIPGRTVLGPILLWLMEHGDRFLLIVIALMMFRAVNGLRRIRDVQLKHSFALSGLLNYLECSDMQFDEGIERLRRWDSLDSLKRLARTKLTLWVIGHVWGDPEMAAAAARTEPFATRLKRGNELITWREDLAASLREAVKESRNRQSPGLD